MTHNKFEDRRVNYGSATVPWSDKNNAWRLPCGKFTKDRNEALNTAKRMDRVITGRALTVDLQYYDGKEIKPEHKRKDGGYMKKYRAHKAKQEI